MIQHPHLPQLEIRTYTFIIGKFVHFRPDGPTTCIIPRPWIWHSIYYHGVRHWMNGHFWMSTTGRLSLSKSSVRIMTIRTNRLQKFWNFFYQYSLGPSSFAFQLLSSAFIARSLWFDFCIGSLILNLPHFKENFPCRLTSILTNILNFCHFCLCEDFCNSNSLGFPSVY